ncbi:hypothetical protein [Breoghania sp.]|uniref:hypothetical protein n=1 Tax=Breoghania sp. TaxID=2065378 RepID=UPI00262C69D1|nr:hypothetical protein [Breoghania sp.]
MAVLTERSLWPDNVPSALSRSLDYLKKTLFSHDPNWHVWTDWYEVRLKGVPSDEALEVARVTLPEPLWEQGAAAVNAELLNLTELARKGPEAVEARMDELRRQYGDDNPKTPPDSAPEPAESPNVWMLQYKPDERTKYWLAKVRPGGPLSWKSGRMGVLSEICEGDRSSIAARSRETIAVASPISVSHCVLRGEGGRRHLLVPDPRH